MTEIILDLCELVSITITGFLIKKYVFLEPELSSKKQQIFYAICVVLIGISFPLFGKDITECVVLVMMALNSFIARKKLRILGAVVMLPLSGIINGLLVPVLLIPPYLLSFSDNGTIIWRFAIYGVVFALLIGFFVFGKSWRRWFNENARDRNLRFGETALLYIIGILMMFFANGVDFQIQSATEQIATVAPFMAISGITAFVMTITIIVLIMQGNKRTYYHKRVSRMQFNIITMMADIVENRDGNTGGHIKRTAKYVEIIARELMHRKAFPDILTKKYVEDMVIAAPLHDIGKIHISDLILNKPGRLTDEEFAIMKTHTTAGGELLTHAIEELGESSYLEMALAMALYHHEWWNGKGYPHGISGDEIPLCARVMAVADVFDALTAKRCYKSAMPLEKALGIIREETGTHFDPVVAEAFLDVIRAEDLEV